MIDHELTDPTGSALTITHNVDGVWVTATDTRDEVTVGPFPARALRASFDMGGDLMDGGVTAAAIEAEVVSPERARSLVHERDEAKDRVETVEAYAAETIAEAQAETTAAVTRAEKAEQERDSVQAAMSRAIEENPRPLTADNITDEARGRAYRTVAALSVCDWDDMSGVAKGRAMALSEAVITEITRPEPPSRPEGAEGLAEVLRTFPGTLAGIRDISDHLASHGVRVTGAES